MFGKCLEVDSWSCVSYDVVCGMFYYVGCGKAPISEDDRQKRELRRLVVQTRLGRF